jgi:predicted ATP-grasp superfamily ATP-dependent carboligase
MRFERFLERAATRHPAIILQVSWANGLDIMRDLARHDVPLLAVDANPRALGLSSRRAAGLVCPDPKSDEEAFVSFLEDLGRKLPQRGLLFPTHDEYIWPISRHAERLDPWFIIPFSRWETMQHLYDKRTQLESAWRCGVDTPRTVFVDSAADLQRGVEEIGFPAIFKPVESLAFKLRFRRHVLTIDSHEELERVYAQVDDCGTLMLQDIVPGGDEELYTLGSYLDEESRPLAVFTGHKLRQHPPMFGHCRMAVSRWVPEMADAGVRLLQELGYHGVSQVEFKRDVHDGRYKLMEINARHWMWHALGTDSGVNLSYAAYSDAIGRPFIAPRQTEDGKWAIFLTDARDALREWRKGERQFLPWIRTYTDVRRDGLYDIADPMPGLLATTRQLRRTVTRRPPKGTRTGTPS